MNGCNQNQQQWRQPRNQRPIPPQGNMWSQQLRPQGLPAPRTHAQRRGVPVWTAVLCAVSALLVGNVVGCGVGAGSTDSTPNDESQEQIADRKKQLSALDEKISEAQTKLDKLNEKVEHAKRETIGDGVWTAGKNMDAGTYRPVSEVSSSCYIAVYNPGERRFSNMVWNDSPSGGFPEIQLKDGQQVSIERCGTDFRKE